MLFNRKIISEKSQTINFNFINVIFISNYQNLILQKLFIQGFIKIY